MLLPRKLNLLNCLYCGVFVPTLFLTSTANAAPVADVSGNRINFNVSGFTFRIFSVPLTDLPPISLLPLPLGTYWLYLGVDNNPDGSISWNNLALDGVEVHIIPGFKRKGID